MTVLKSTKLSLMFILVFAMLTGNFAQQVGATGETKTVTVTSVYNDDSVIIQETVELTEEGATALDALMKAAGDEVGTSEDPKFGKSIDSIKNSQILKEHFWAFYVNGTFSTSGAPSYEVKDGDKITFYYVSWTKPTPETFEPPVKEETAKLTSVTKDQIQKAVNSAEDNLLKNGVTEWEAVALKQASKEIPTEYLEGLKKIIKDKQGSFDKITDSERYSLGILASGGNPSSFEGYNLIESIYNGDVTKQGLNGVAYALITLNSSNFDIPKSAVWTKEKLVNHLLEKQNKDGGWNWDGSAISDPDTTAMVITALAPYQKNLNTKVEIKKAVTFMEEQYEALKINNSSTASQMVVALSALNIDAAGEKFTNKNGSLISYLVSFQNEDGGFYFDVKKASDDFSTEQGALGLVAYKLYLDGKGKLYSLGDSTSKSADPNEEQTKTNTTVIYGLIAFGMILVSIVSILFFKRKRKNS